MDSLRNFCLIITLCLALINVYATTISSDDYYNPNTISAHVDDMFRYGEFQTSLFTGRMQQTIPIYTVNDPDFNINIALHYNAEGFKSRKHSGPVGYNWFLEAGGCITREVNGYPDETCHRNAPYHYEGMYHFITRTSGVDKNDVFNLPYDMSAPTCPFGIFPVHVVGNDCHYDTDYEPDIFHFDFLGYKGSFMINNEGKVRIINGDYVEVDLSGILENESSDILVDDIFPYPENENSAITIRTTDGYTYIFGGDFSKLEYTIDTYRDADGMNSFSPSHDNVNVFSPNISTWYLARIIAPNGRTVAFNYMPATEWALPGDEPQRNSHLWEINEIFNWYVPYYAWAHSYMYGDPCDIALGMPDFLPNSFYSRSATKTCRLESIEISGEQPLRIVFENVLETLRMYEHNNYGCETSESLSKKNYQLDSICVLSSGRTIKTARFSYVYGSHSGNDYSFNWRFLNSVRISGVGIYQMEYYNGDYPDLENLSWTANSLNSFTNAENDEMDEYGYYVGDSLKMALLKKITYPTGGYQTYDYEAQVYDKKRKYRVVNGADLEMQDVVENGSKRGARIKKARTYNTNNQLVETKEYTYSDGIYYDNLKVYNLREVVAEEGWPIVARTCFGLLDTHIGYGQVTESVSNAQGTYKTVYRFDMGENLYSSANDNDLIGRYYCDNPIFGIMTGNMLYGSKLRKWGKLMSIDNYDSDDRLLRSTFYGYNDTPAMPGFLNNDYLSPSHFCLDTIVIFTHRFQSDISKKLYIYPDVKTQELTKDYGQSGGRALETMHLYSCDTKLRVNRETVIDSHGMSHFTKYMYPDDIPGADVLGASPSPLFMLINDKRIGEPVETISGFIENETEYITNGTIKVFENNTYGEPISPGIGALHILPYLHQTHSLALSEPITDYQPMSMSGGQVSYDQRYRLTCEYNFDLMYRPLSIKPFGKMATTYTWNGIYPTSKTVGNQTTTYTFIPHVGVSSITDPRGVTTYYSYDSAGRLIEEYQIINGTKQVLNAYKYHIKTE